MSTDRWIERSFWSELTLLNRQKGVAWALYAAEVAEMRRTSGLGLLSPFISVVLYSAVIGSVMALVFGEPIDVFIPYFAVSFPLWQAISNAVSEASYANEKSARFLSFPKMSSCIVHLTSTYSLLLNLVLKLTAAALVIVVISPQTILSANYPAAVFGVMFLALTMLSWALPMTYVMDRFRLLRGFVPQALMAIYLVTPILWLPERLAAHPLVYELNPIYHLVESVRAPLLYGTVPAISLAVCFGLFLAGLLMSVWVFRPNRKLIVYGWVA